MPFIVPSRNPNNVPNQTHTVMQGLAPAEMHTKQDIV